VIVLAMRRRGYGFGSTGTPDEFLRELSATLHEIHSF
jgi:hypothetical protein